MIKEKRTAELWLKLDQISGHLWHRFPQQSSGFLKPFERMTKPLPLDNLHSILQAPILFQKKMTGNASCRISYIYTSYVVLLECYYIVKKHSLLKIWNHSLWRKVLFLYENYCKFSICKSKKYKAETWLYLFTIYFIINSS